MNFIKIADQLILQASHDKAASDSKESTTQMLETLHDFIDADGEQHGPDTMENLNLVVESVLATSSTHIEKAIKVLNATLYRIGKRTGEESTYNGKYLKIPTKRGEYQGAISKQIKDSKAPPLSVKALIERAQALAEELDKFGKAYGHLDGAWEVVEIARGLVYDPTAVIPEVTTILEKNVIAFDINRAA